MFPINSTIVQEVAKTVYQHVPLAPMPPDVSLALQGLIYMVISVRSHAHQDLLLVLLQGNVLLVLTTV